MTRDPRDFVGPSFLNRHFRLLVQQAIVYLGKAEVQKILDDAEVGG
jgi:hypothetical protein